MKMKHETDKQNKERTNKRMSPITILDKLTPTSVKTKPTTLTFKIYSDLNG